MNRPFRILGLQQIAIGGPDRMKLRHLWVDVFGLGLEDLLALSHRGQAQPRQCPNGLTLWIQARTDTPRASAIEPPPAPETGVATATDAPTIPTLNHANRALIEATLAACDGNVSRAARQLGVSRGLLYRRLGEWRGDSHRVESGPPAPSAPPRSSFAPSPSPAPASPPSTPSSSSTAVMPTHAG